MVKIIITLLRYVQEVILIYQNIVALKEIKERLLGNTLSPRARFPILYNVSKS
jgi:hypothetical protein